MKAILMMICGFVMMNNVFAQCPQEMGYLAPVDVLPACSDGSNDVQSQSPVQEKLVTKDLVSSADRESLRTASVTVFEQCPQDIGYLAPSELLAPCPAAAGDSAGVAAPVVSSRSPAMQQAQALVVDSSPKRRGPKVQVAQQGGLGQ